jgi:hypothetical protein
MSLFTSDDKLDIEGLYPSARLEVNCHSRNRHSRQDSLLIYTWTME